MMQTLAAVALMAAAGASAGPDPSAARRATYVIVHGAWGGSWDWRRVDELMSAQGQRVVRVQLTGMGERAHLNSPDIGLGTHIMDVVNTILWEDLRDVVLVGHSYGGMVITGAADRVPDRIRHLVYVDAFVPRDGESLMDIAPAGTAAFLKSATRSGFVVPPWLKENEPIPHDVPQSLKTFTEKLTLVSPAARGLPATYILTVEPGRTTDDFDPFAERAGKQGFTVKRLAGDHLPERSAREALIELLRAVP
jgi:pimeloyl-ACP methyl ester carboxylesterase